jgi:hypothetical protein
MLLILGFVQIFFAYLGYIQLPHIPTQIWGGGLCVRAIGIPQNSTDSTFPAVINICTYPNTLQLRMDRFL